MTYDVFLSYSRRDVAQVTLLATRLTHEAGLRVRPDLARLQPGFSWRAEIETAMNDSTAVLIVWGSSGTGAGTAPRTRPRLCHSRRPSRLPGYLPLAAGYLATPGNLGQCGHLGAF